MKRKHHSILDSDPGRLASLMDMDDGAGRLWSEDELAAILRHQMSAPLQVDLGGLQKGLPGRLQTLAAAKGLLLRSFGDLLHHPNPPVELLILTKDFAKACRISADSPIPREIATLLYFASIAVARLRCGRRITALTDAAVRKGLDWALGRPWLDEATRSLCEEGLRSLSSRAERKMTKGRSQESE